MSLLGEKPRDHQSSSNSLCREHEFPSTSLVEKTNKLQLVETLQHTKTNTPDSCLMRLLKKAKQ